MTATKTLTLAPRWQGPETPLRHTWAPIGNVDQFRWLVRDDLRRQLATAREELGLRHVRACAMYSPEMRVWGHDLSDWRKPAAERALGANWQMVNEGLDGLLDLGLKPVYTTSFTPAGFTDRKATCWPDRNPVGLPRDLDAWADFVASGLRHHRDRYGADEMRSWFFECWNEPNLAGTFFEGTRAEWFALWDATWRAVKSVDEGFRLGGPSTARGEWIPDFLEHTRKQRTLPDILMTHVYNNDSAMAPLSPFDGPAADKVVDSPHFAAGVIRGVRSLARAGDFHGPVHWNEWGRSWFPSDPLRETGLEAAFVVKTMAEVGQEADAFAFWCLSDIYDQAGYQNREFAGHYGMLSLHGLRKPVWQAHRLLESLGARSVPVDGGSPLEGALATLDPDPQVLVWTYPGTFAGSMEPESIQVKVRAPAHARRAWAVALGAEENNIVAAWKHNGAPPYPSRERIREWQQTSRDLTRRPLAVQRDEGGVWAEGRMERPGVMRVVFET